MGIAKTIATGVLAGLVGGAVQYGAAVAYEKLAKGLTTRGKVLGLAATQLGIGTGLGLGAWALRGTLGEEVAVPVATTMIALGTTTAGGLVIVAAQMPKALSAPSEPAQLP